MTDTASAISIQGVSKMFGQTVAVNDLSLDIREGEFLTLLGPSGCGKTTTMRMMAGFEDPDSGAIYLKGTDVVGLPPNKRPVNMCFQNYALFPHMSVRQNVEYGLRLKRVSKAERTGRIDDILDVVRLTGMEDRRPGQLSGGQQQRVALARALVNRPAALLLDEPLGALDVKLRRQMQLELKRIQHELHTTFVYVTHDQEEALSMSDRIAVMNSGVIEQLGTPREVYQHPATPFVADFVGVLNAFEVQVERVDPRGATCPVDDGRVMIDTVVDGVVPGMTVLASVRPERVTIFGEDHDADSAVPGVVEQVVYLGSITQVIVATGSLGRLTVCELSATGADRLAPGDHVTLCWSAEDTSILSVS